MSAATLRYSLRIKDIAAKRLEVGVSVAAAPSAHMRLRLPAWVPGSYLIREFAGHIIQLSAESRGRPLAVRKEDKSTWVVDASRGEPVDVVYELFAPEASVRTNDVSHDHAFVSPGATFLQVVGLEGAPALLRVEPPPGWQVATALAAASAPESAIAGVDAAAAAEGGAVVLQVPDFETLVDSPLEIGPHATYHFTAAGRPHTVVIHGDGNLDRARFLTDTARIVEAETALFGSAPYDRYLFIVHLTHDRSGGLEHANSCAVAWPKLKFRPEKEYRKFLTLVAHEFFHLWNVKRIRPEALTSADLSAEAYTRLLWVFEGITSYYDELLPLRGGLYGAPEFFELVSERIGAEAARPGRAVQSLADSSFDTWIKLYRPSPDTANSQVSYYERGALVALLLDLLLRQRSSDARSLDDVMRWLMRGYGETGRGLAEDEFPAVVQQATGVDVSAYLAAHVHGTSSLPYDELLAHVGLRLRPKAREANAPEPGWTGLRLENGGAPLRATAVVLGSPAHSAGLMAGDEIIALDGHRLGQSGKEQLELYQPGETATWTAFRRDRLVHGTITFGHDPCPPLELVVAPDAMPQQRSSFERWAGTRWPGASA